MKASLLPVVAATVSLSVMAVAAAASAATAGTPPFRPETEWWQIDNRTGRCVIPDDDGITSTPTELIQGAIRWHFQYKTADIKDGTGVVVVANINVKTPKSDTNWITYFRGRSVCEDYARRLAEKRNQELSQYR